MQMQRTNSIDTFEAFLPEWLVRQESFLVELQNSINELNPHESLEDEAQRLSDLVDRVSAHYYEYLNAKSRVAEENILLIFTPTWFTPLEKTFLWIAGFKPALAFRVIKTFIHDLDDDQQAQMEKARKETRLEERKLMYKLTRIQETIAAPPILEMARRAGGMAVVDGEVDGLESAVDELKKEMEEVLECADFLRLKSVMKIMEILGSRQNVVFFAAVGRFQLQVRRWGLELQAAAAASSSSSSD